MFDRIYPNVDTISNCIYIHFVNVGKYFCISSSIIVYIVFLGVLDYLLFTDTLNYVCPICGKGVRAEGQLQRHMKTHTDQPVEIYRCRFCNKEFKDKAKTYTHEKYQHILKV